MTVTRHCAHTQSGQGLLNISILKTESYIYYSLPIIIPSKVCEHIGVVAQELRTNIGTPEIFIKYIFADRLYNHLPLAYICTHLAYYQADMIYNFAPPEHEFQPDCNSHC